jgi:hypothetical protein
MVAQSRDPLLGIRRSSVRFVRSIVYSRLVGNPIRFPGLAAILREGLFKVRLIRVSFRPNESHQDISAFHPPSSPGRPQAPVPCTALSSSVMVDSLFEMKYCPV